MPPSCRSGDRDTRAQCEREQGPFEAVLAFSMGAVFAQIVCTARAYHASASFRAEAASEDASSPFLLPGLKFAVSSSRCTSSVNRITCPQVFVACRPHKDQRFQPGVRVVPSFHMCVLVCVHVLSSATMPYRCDGCSMRLISVAVLATQTQ
jgi:hypothetical protein